MSVIKETLARLDALDLERGILRAQVWMRIVPFARRREYIRTLSEPLPSEKDLKGYGRVDFRILNNGRDFAAAAAPALIYVEITTHWYNGDNDEDTIELEIPADRFFASEEDNAVYWAAVARADAEAQKIADEQKRVAEEQKQAKRKATIEARERAQFEELKRKFEKS
jgi:hypothetical protein